MAATTGRGTAAAMARHAVEQGREMVIGCGGDGTINEIVNGLAGSQVPLAVLPAGTANVLAKELGIPWDIPAAARLIPGGTCRRVALGVATPVSETGSVDQSRASRFFLCVAGAGPDGAIVHAIDEGAKERTGILAYWAEGFRQWFRYRFPEIEISSNGKTFKATIIVVGRTAHYGGPFKITTGASLFEDSFEMLINTTRNRWRYLECLPALWLGRLRRMEGIHTWKATDVTCRPAGDFSVFAQVDGEPCGVLPLQFHIVPDALTLILPARDQA